MLRYSPICIQTTFVVGMFIIEWDHPDAKLKSGFVFATMTYLCCQRETALKFPAGLINESIPLGNFRLFLELLSPFGLRPPQGSASLPSDGPRERHEWLDALKGSSAPE